MRNLLRCLLLPLIFSLASSITIIAQSTISGTVKDGNTGEALSGAHIVLKGSIYNTISDINGKFRLNVNQAPPFIISFSFVGFITQEVEVKDAIATFDISLSEQTLLGQEIVVSASRIEESIMKSPVTIEKMDILSIRQAATPDFFDAVANMKGVTATSSSLNFNSINTRGFSSISNVRFVLLVDGMDVSAPVLNFPSGSITGLGELDTENIELIPGASSALYGPNAFNGLMMMKSKSPFDYQGLSMQVKQGVTTSDAGGSRPMGLYAIRYAKSFNDKIAFKVNFSYLDATDWQANDYKADRNDPESQTDLSNSPSFDSMNKYGDETVISLGYLGIPGIGDVTRTGFKGPEMLDTKKVNTIKGDIALHYRITQKVEASYDFRFGGGNTFYLENSPYAFKDYLQQFHKIEVKGDNFFVRSYLSIGDGGKSYNVSALGGYANETWSLSKTSWVPDYITAFTGGIPNVAAGDPATARAYADRNMPQAGTPEYKSLMKAVRANYFQQPVSGTWTDKDGIVHDVAGGASFKEDSRMWHNEFNYSFKKINWADIMVGGNFRQYGLLSHGTVLNEAPDDPNPVKDYKRLYVNQVGVYSQVAKTLAEKWKLTGSLRYDKSDNFNGYFTPRISTVYSINKNHNIRASYQTGLRIPQMQAQYIYFPSPTGTFLGTTKDNSERYGVMNGLAYTQASYNAFVMAGGKVDPNSTSGTINSNGAILSGDASLLKAANIPYLKPEHLKAFEIGYKGLLATNLFADVNYYYSSYSNFIALQTIVSKNLTYHQGNQVNAGSLWTAFANATEKVTSQGIGVGLTYNLPRDFSLNGNYNWTTFSANESPDFIAGFNTPRNRFSVGLANRKIAKYFGFNINYRYQETFLWYSTWSPSGWHVPAFGVVDAQVSYRLAPVEFKIGGVNIGGSDYRTSIGGPFVGQQYYISVTYDQFSK